METIFGLATQISEPLGLAGFFAAVVLYIFKQVVSKDFLRQLTSAHSLEVIKTIIDRLFILALFAMFLGFLGFLLTKWPQPGIPPVAVVTGSPLKPVISGGVSSLNKDVDGSASSGCRWLSDVRNNKSEVAFRVENVRSGMAGQMLAIGRSQGFETLNWTVDGEAVELNDVKLVNESKIVIRFPGADDRVLVSFPAPPIGQCADHELHIRGIKVRFVSR